LSAEIGPGVLPFLALKMKIRFGILPKLFWHLQDKDVKEDKNYPVFIV